MIPRILATVPCLNESRAITDVVTGIRTHLPVVLVVDDASSDDTGSKASQAGAIVIRHPQTRGKGAAIRTALEYAHANHYDWLLMMDGDGQHSPEDIPSFIGRIGKDKRMLIIGNRMQDRAAMPWVRQWANRLSSRLISWKTGRKIPDSQSGFRLLPVAAFTGGLLKTSHYEIESEMLVTAIRSGLNVVSIPIRILSAPRHSKIHPFWDTCRWIKWWLWA